MNAAEPIPLDDDYQDAAAYEAEMNALREQEAREAWERIKARDLAVARVFRLTEATLATIAEDHRTIEFELGFTQGSNRYV